MGGAPAASGYARRCRRGSALLGTVSLGERRAGVFSERGSSAFLLVASCGFPLSLPSLTVEAHWPSDPSPDAHPGGGRSIGELDVGTGRDGKLLAHVEDVSNAVVRVCQRIGADEIDKIPSVLVVVYVRAAGAPSTAHLGEIMNGLAVPLPRLSVRPLPVQYGHLLPLHLHLGVFCHSRPGFVHTDDEERWLGQRDDPGLVRVGRQGHLEGIGDNLSSPLAPAGPFQLLHETHGVVYHLDVEQFVPLGELTPQHARHDALGQRAALDRVLRSKDEGAHEDVLGEEHVILVDVIVGPNLRTARVGGGVGAGGSVVVSDQNRGRGVSEAVGRSGACNVGVTGGVVAPVAADIAILGGRGVARGQFSLTPAGNDDGVGRASDADGASAVGGGGGSSGQRGPLVRGTRSAHDGGGAHHCGGGPRPRRCCCGGVGGGPGYRRGGRAGLSDSTGRASLPYAEEGGKGDGGGRVQPGVGGGASPVRGAVRRRRRGGRLDAVGDPPSPRDVGGEAVSSALVRLTRRLRRQARHGRVACYSCVSWHLECSTRHPAGVGSPLLGGGHFVVA
mmetsp:Transcript_1932/g.5100  ORF Transcript_1932/g.5100 Transcript_1932/m.5100 type:complete len:561 (-) Transcript_1932:1591-3273(-)